MSWLRRRAFRHGNVTVRVQKLLAPGFVHHLLLWGKTLGLVGVGGLRYLACWPRSTTRRHAELMVWRGIGKCLANAGYYHIDTRTIDGY